MINLTKAAIPHIKRILGSHKAIFFGVKGGGCNGFEYVLKPTNEVNGENMDDLVSIEKIPFVMCGKSTFLYIGTTIDWKEDYMGNRFDFTNPASTGTCGCGSTFSVDINET